MVRNVECCPLFEVTSTVLEVVKVQQLFLAESSTESPDQQDRYPRRVLMFTPSNHGAGFLKTAGTNGWLLPLDEAISKWIKSSGGLLCGD